MLSLFVKTVRWPVTCTLLKQRNLYVSTLLRFKSNSNSDEAARRLKNRSTLYYATAATVLFVGLTYAAVPLYRMFCQVYSQLFIRTYSCLCVTLQATSYGGTTAAGHDSEKVESMKKIKDKVISIKFNADLAASMRWNFRPQQYEIKVSFLIYVLSQILY